MTGVCHYFHLGAKITVSNFAHREISLSPQSGPDVHPWYWLIAQSRCPSTSARGRLDVGGSDIRGYISPPFSQRHSDGGALPNSPTAG